ncbi:MAG: DUF2304 domain-containing protein [Clostridiales bacterium]|nr:DUF2304 domain-containing protein [Clostridiales bacterium]
MSLMLRICLIAASILTMVVMMRQIRRSKVQIEDAIYWVLFSLTLILFSLCPKIVYILSDLVGTEAPSNFIFLLVIFLLLLKVFSLSVRLSQLETRLRELAQKIAIEQFEAEEKESADSISGTEDHVQDQVAADKVRENR